MDKRIEELLLRYCEGLATEEERRQVEMWMDEGEENRRIAWQMNSLYIAADTYGVTKKIDTEKALHETKNRMNARRKTAWQWLQRAAAILFIPLLAAWVWQYASGSKEEAVQMLEVKTNPGMTTSLTLPDGTAVCLNSESTLRYPSRFGNERNVTLQGEAYFDVAKNAEKKFIVSTLHSSQIEVLGTKFNVEAYAKDNRISATLLEGKIGFVFQNKRLLMNPGQKLIYNTKNEDVKLYATCGESETAWKEGKIIFNNTPLADGLRMLEKRYGVTFVIANPQLIDYSFTGTFTHQRLDRILEYFRLSSRIRWRYIDSSEITDEQSKIEIY